MNKESAQIVIDILRNLHDKRDCRCFTFGTGICNNLGFQLSYTDIGVDSYDLADEIIKKYSIGWEPHTGDANYPIAGYSDRDKDGNKVLWVGKQLKLRQSLIRHIIAKLEADFIPTSGNYRWNKADKNLMDMWWI